MREAGIFEWLVKGTVLGFAAEISRLAPGRPKMLEIKWACDPPTPLKW